MIRRWMMLLACFALLFMAAVPATAQVVVILDNGPPDAAVAPTTATVPVNMASLEIRSSGVAVEPASLPTASKRRTVIAMPTETAAERNEVLLIFNNNGSAIQVMPNPTPRPRRIIVYH